MFRPVFRVNCAVQYTNNISTLFSSFVGWVTPQVDYFHNDAILNCQTKEHGVGILCVCGCHAEKNLVLEHAQTFV
jgi:hypothetical protein